MHALTLIRSLTRDQRNTFIASFLGWSLDAFDYFVVTFVVVRIAHDFKQAIATVTLAITLTLAMRWLGALIFGWLADRFGRTLPLMIDIIFYSAIELLTAFSPNLTIFLILRALYGIGMGGEWGVGASLAMEALPTQTRGFFSGLLQQGYATGYLLAAIAFFVITPHFGWRALFIVGALPALLVLFIRARVPESAVWQHQQRQQTAPRVRRIIGPYAHGQPAPPGIGRMALLYGYVIVLMTSFNFMSHGTQDLYPTFLQLHWHLPPGGVTLISVTYNIGAIIGGMLFGFYSQRWGRRRTIAIAASLGILVIPLWTFAPSVALLTVGAFLMQFFVQGAWGVIPIHLNELAPARARGAFPGFTYQIGNALSAPAATLEAYFAATYFHTSRGPDYARAQGVLALIVFVAVICLTLIGNVVLGRERFGFDFMPTQPAARKSAKAVAAQVRTTE